ncbi:T9SS type A sorting domain-containing protein [Patiriisocius hiemis]|uniref:T9SS type A sorting domain-containing protein n=1 Tax=Patiriisocius hiemis TaxID=3075604 RepID=A0ABU2YHR0_9FLAO|nr:T9SS type A sorting domain-containing protein [Constantimarinum sp. W242]MDT0556795.1 T9SS type A sorting domain-containing protein [Constantimarinum sp. W242]
MKKFYLLAIFAFGLAASANAQFTDDIESYTPGPLFTPRWTTWDGTNDGAQNAIVSTAQASSGIFSIFIGPDSGGQDAVLDFEGLLTSGTWTILWSMYIESGSTGYFNLQGDVTPNANANLEFLSGDITLVSGTLTDANGGATLTYPEDEWFFLKAVVDLDAATYELSINGVAAPAAPITGVSGFGGVDYFADSATNSYYVDDVRLEQGVLGIDDFSADVFSVYPNPVQDVLNIKSAAAVNEVVVYDVLGKVVLQSRPDAISPSINMSGLNSGAYMVKVTIDGASKTIKVIK